MCGIEMDLRREILSEENVKFFNLGRDFADSLINLPIISRFFEEERNSHNENFLTRARGSPVVSRSGACCSIA